jgi:hypothetical protein
MWANFLASGLVVIRCTAHMTAHGFEQERVVCPAVEEHGVES